MHTHSIASQLAQLRSRSISSRELTQHYLERIKRLDPAYNSFVTVTAEQAP